jgi:transglutaminase-like putative cysteine protease
MNKLLTGLFLTISICATAQKPPIKFGDVKIEDLQMKVYEKDSSASAVVLADFGESTITYNQMSGFKLTFERITRIKILNRNGLDWANFEIPLYHDGSDTEKATNIKGITYNFDGGKITENKVGSDGIFREKNDANLDIVKVIFPNVREGSIVEISYTVISDFLFNFQDWTFQSRIPTVWSEYRAGIPEFFNYDKYTQGYIQLEIVEQKNAAKAITLSSFERSSNSRDLSSTPHTENIDYQEIRYRWAAKDIPAFKDEPYMTTYRDFISKLNFELSFIKMPNEPMKPMLGSWEEINNKFEPVYSEEIKGNNFLKKIVQEITAGAATPEEKVSAIVNYVKQNVNWNGYSTKYTDNPMKKVLEEKKGNSAEINLLLASMLEKADIPVSAVLLSTRDHGMIRQATPASTQFNYLICAVTIGDKITPLDATEKLLPTNLLPKRCLNTTGFMVGMPAFTWINLESKFKTRSVTSADLTLSPEAELSGKLKLDNNGYAALTKRKNYFSQGEQEYVKGFIGSHAWDHKGIEVQNAENTSSNFVEVHQLAINENITAAEDVVYLDPFLVNGIKTNPFKSQTREYPVDFGSPEEQMYSFKLTIPDNYQFDEVPQSKVFMLPENSAKYVYSVSVNANVISITSILSINRSLFTQPEYEGLREFYNQVVAKQTQQIVLKKKL